MGKPDEFNERYGKYFAKLPDKDAYLKRIGLGNENIPLTKEGLDRLQLAHLYTVPFENIDVYDYDMKLDFGIEELYDKVVTRRRGGYCFELNSIYMALLEAVGFDVYPVGVRVIKGCGYITAVNHRASLVTIDGKRYFTDVGFGVHDAPGIAICVDDCGGQDIQGDIYTAEDRPYDNKMILNQTDKGMSELLMFALEPFNILDFIIYNTAFQMDYNVRRLALMRTPDGCISLDGDIFRRRENGNVTETPLPAADDAYNILTEKFGMILTEPLKASVRK